MAKIAQEFLPIAFFKNEFIPFFDAKISVATHALHYGTSAFGGMRALVNPERENEILLFRLDKHAKRLANSAKYLNYEISEDLIKQKIIEFVEKNPKDSNYYIRPLVYISELGIAPRLHDIEKNFLIYGLKFGDYLKPEGIKVTFSSWFRPSDNSITSKGKIGGTYVNSATAKTEAVQRGFDEALMLDSRGFVTEASAMNIFMVKEKKLITPPLQADILEGITRMSVMEIAQNLGLEVEEREISKSELLVADEVFLTGTAAKITPIYQIEFYKLPKDKPVSKKLSKLFTEITLGKNPKYEDWVTKVN